MKFTINNIIRETAPNVIDNWKFNKINKEEIQSEQISRIVKLMSEL